jgi:hypothetical protein
MTWEKKEKKARAYVMGEKTAPFGLEGSESAVEEGDADEQLPFVGDELVVAFFRPGTSKSGRKVQAVSFDRTRRGGRRRETKRGRT